MQSCAFLPALLLAASFISQAANAQSNALPINNNAGLLLLQQNARAGDAKAEYRLGMIYLNGEGVSQDYKQGRIGLVRPQNRAPPMGNSPWATFSNEAKVCREISLALLLTTRRPPGRDTRPRKIIWALCMNMAREFRKI